MLQFRLKVVRLSVKDAFENSVPGDTILWLPKTGGNVSNNFSITNSQGIAEIRWILHTSTDPDTLAAYSKNFTTSPDTVYFVAFPKPQTNLRLSYLVPGDTLRTGAIFDTLDAFKVKVTDTLGNVVPNVEVSFAIVEHPEGSTGEKFTQYSTLTNSNGEAETQLILGSRLGKYKVRAFANAQPTFLTFTGIANIPGRADTIRVLAGNNQTGVVGTPLANDITFQLLDAYENPLKDSILIFQTLDGGNVTPDSRMTDAEGKANVSWTLGNLVGNYRMRDS